MNVLERFFEYKILYCYDIFDRMLENGNLVNEIKKIIRIERFENFFF